MAGSALITLNILRTSRMDPTKSAYHQLHGHRYDWNAHLLAPPGSKGVIYESPEDRTSWGYRGLDAWYCGMDNFYVPETRVYRITGSFDLFPQHCMLPEFDADQHAAEVHDELFKSIQHMQRPARNKLLKKMPRRSTYYRWILHLRGWTVSKQQARVQFRGWLRHLKLLEFRGWLCHHRLQHQRILQIHAPYQPNLARIYARRGTTHQEQYLL